MAKKILLLSLVALTYSYLTFAFEPAPIQDFCVTDSSSSVRVNGLACKDPMKVQTSDFSFSRLHIASTISNAVGFNIKAVNVAQISGFNTLGISMVRLDYAPWGLNPPHIHPQASEILTVIKGSLEVGFVTSNPENHLLSKALQKGDVFVFLVGLVHFQRNVGHGNVVATTMLSSQNPRTITIANVVFGSNAPIASDLLAKAFQIDTKVVEQIQSNF